MKIEAVSEHLIIGQRVASGLLAMEAEINAGMIVSQKYVEVLGMERSLSRWKSTQTAANLEASSTSYLRFHNFK